MITFIREAGLGIWPVFLFGVVGLVIAGRYAARPRRDALVLMVGVAVVTLLMGTLGGILGFQASAGGLGHAQTPLVTFLAGVREALNAVVAALVFVTAHAVIATYGTIRFVRKAEIRGQK